LLNLDSLLLRARTTFLTEVRQSCLSMQQKNVQFQVSPQVPVSSLFVHHSFRFRPVCEQTLPVSRVFVQRNFRFQIFLFTTGFSVEVCSSIKASDADQFVNNCFRFPVCLSNTTSGIRSVCVQQRPASSLFVYHSVRFVHNSFRFRVCLCTTTSGIRSVCVLHLPA